MDRGRKRIHQERNQPYVELAHTKQRIRAKTAWNADTLRGDYADVLILDEFQLMSEAAGHGRRADAVGQ